MVVSNVSRTRRRVHQRPVSDCSALQTHSRIRGGGGSLTRQSWLLLFQAGRGWRHLPFGDLSTTTAQERWRMTLPAAEGAHSPHRRATRHHIWPSTAVFAPDCGATAVDTCWRCIIMANSCDPVFSDVRCCYHCRQRAEIWPATQQTSHALLVPHPSALL